MSQWSSATLAPGTNFSMEGGKGWDRRQSSDGVGCQGMEQVTSCCGLGLGGQREGRDRWQSSGELPLQPGS